MKHSLTSILRYGGLAVAVLALSVGGGFVGAGLAGSNESVTIGAGSAPAQPASVSPTPASMNVSTDSENVSRAFQDQFRTVAAATLPVVVEINTVSTVTREVPTNPFSFFFGQPGQKGPQEQQYQQRGLGSGVMVARDRDTVYVLTNNHVAGEADEIEVVLSDGRKYTGSLVGTDDLMDLALVSFQTQDDIPIAQLGDSSSLEIGDWVFAVGNPLGFQSSVTAGIVSAKERSVTPQSGISGITSYIQTDAAINQGNSGGALVNLEGQVVGINTWIASRSGGSDGIGFAIPINMAQRAITDFIERGEVAYSWLGVMTGDPSDALRTDLGAPDSGGAFVYGVYDNSPAAEGGIQPGDVVLQIGDTEIQNGGDLVRSIATLPPGDEVAVRVLRNGAQTELTIKTSVRDSQAGADTQQLWPGLAVQPLTDQIRSQLDLSRRTDGVVVASVTDGTPAQGSGIRRGDVVTTVNGTTIESAQDFYRALAGMDSREVQFRVLRDGNTVILGFVRPR